MKGGKIKMEENREKEFCDNLLDKNITREEALSIMNFFIGYFDINQDELDFDVKI